MMSSSAGLKTLSVVSEAMTSRALMIVMPARMNTPSFLRCPAHDETLDLGRDVEKLVDADAVLVAGAGAEVTAGTVPEGVALGIGATGLEVEGQLLLVGSIGRLAVVADPAHEPLADDRQHR